jgi:UDP-N-acetylglucosamine 2-epimerase
MKVVTVIGARPQFVKAAVVSRAVAAHNARSADDARIAEVILHTGQHYDDQMSGVFFRELGIPDPAYHLGVGSGTHGEQTGKMLVGIEVVLFQEKPDCVLVYGDTNSTLAGGLAASKLHIPVVHVEAGLRSYNAAMPEEINRVLVDHLSSLLLCPTSRSRKNLSYEGLDKGVHVVGDVMYDSLLCHVDSVKDNIHLLERFGIKPGDYGLATIHRAENTSEPEILKDLIHAFVLVGLPIVMPLHPRSRGVLNKASGWSIPNTVRLVDPLSYHDMLVLEKHARIILTDSGGVQKEAFMMRIPCVTLRNETEWVETLEGGWNRLAGTNPESVVAAAHAALKERPQAHAAVYGDGHAAERIVNVLAESFTRGGV